jgi:hypothetical protein
MPPLLLRYVTAHALYSNPPCADTKEITVSTVTSYLLGHHVTATQAVYRPAGRCPAMPWANPSQYRVTDAQIQRQQGDLISLLLFFQNKRSSLKTEEDAIRAKSYALGNQYSAYQESQISMRSKCRFSDPVPPGEHVQSSYFVERTRSCFLLAQSNMWNSVSVRINPEALWMDEGRKSIKIWMAFSEFNVFLYYHWCHSCSLLKFLDLEVKRGKLELRCPNWELSFLYAPLQVKKNARITFRVNHVVITANQKKVQFRCIIKFVTGWLSKTNSLVFIHRGDKLYITGWVAY